MYKVDNKKRTAAISILYDRLSSAEFGILMNLEQLVYPKIGKVESTHPYHGVSHTRDDVVPNAIHLTDDAINNVTERVSVRDLYLVVAAAVLHDFGQVK